jgi:hypothetical protein
MKDEAIKLVFELFRQISHTGRGDSVHGETDGRFCGLHSFDGASHHANQSVRGVSQYQARYAIQPGDIGDRVYHLDIAGSDIGRHVARRECRHQDLRSADWQFREPRPAISEFIWMPSGGFEEFWPGRFFPLDNA